MNQKPHKSLLFVVIFFLTWLSVGCSTPSSIDAAAPDAPPEEGPYAGKRVLLVDSYHEEYDSSAAIIPAVRSAFEGTGIELRIFYMDTKRNDNEEYARQAAREALAVIEEFDPDVVIATEDNAQEYLVVPYLKDTDLPVVFVGVNWDASPYGYPASNVTGSVEVELIEQLVGHLQEFAAGDRIAYLAVDSSTEQKAVAIYQERFFDGQLDVHLVTTFEEYKAAFIELQDQADILLLGNNGGSDRWDDEEAAELFMEYTRIPTGSVREWTAPYALISLAKVRSEDGEYAAQTVLQILDGTPISELPMTQNKLGNLILNLDIAEKLDIVFPTQLIENASSVYGMGE